MGMTVAPVAPSLSSSQPQPASTSSPSYGTGAFCSGLVVGLVGAGTSMKARAGRSANLSATKAGFDASKQIGVMPPTGYWDPCGCLKERVGKDGWQWKDEATFKKYRAAELKHGRVAMVASVGLIANAWWKFPGFESVPDGLATLQTSQGGAGFGLLFILAGYIELNNPMGDFKDPVGLRAMCVDDDHVLASKELANCRMAMMAVVTLWVIEAGTGISPTSQMTNLELEGFLYPAILTALVALPASGKAWGDTVKDPAWPFKPVATAAIPEKATISMKMPEKEAVKEEVEANVEATA